MTYRPIAYTYDADVHCPDCAADQFGAALDDPETEDSEGNPLGAIFQWDEWWNGGDQCETLVCGDCLGEVDTAHADPHSPDCPEHDDDDDDDDHAHAWGPMEVSRFAGTPHRKCTVPFCSVITLPDDEEEEVTA